MVMVWSEATHRYPELAKLPDVSSGSQVFYISLAENAVASRLSSQFTPPFSSNNLTFKDLAIDMLYIQTQMTRQPEKAEMLKEWFNERVTALLNGDASMLTDSGDVAGTLTGDPVFSTTQDYAPTFGVGDPLDWSVSSSQIRDEADARDGL